MKVHSSCIANSLLTPPPPPEIIQISINWCMDKQILVYQYNGILVFHKKQLATETIRNMDESQKHSTDVYIKF